MLSQECRCPFSPFEKLQKFVVSHLSKCIFVFFLNVQMIIVFVE